MLLSESIYGAGAVRLMTTRLADALLVIGNDRFTRSDLAQASCYAFTAARNVSAILSTAKVTSTKQLYQEFSPFDLALPRLGVISLMVIGAAFEIKDVGTIETWAARHRKRGETELLSFATFKHQHAESELATAAAQRRASRKRRNGHA